MSNYFKFAVDFQLIFANSANHVYLCCKNGHYGRVPVLISSFIFIPNILLTVIHSSISSFLRFTPPGGLLTYGQTSRGGYTSGIPTQSCTANMAPRPGYGIPLDSISPMAAPGSEIERLPTLFIGGISWKNSQGSDQLFNFWWAMNAIYRYLSTN
ncbi:hypothetical protein RhiirC2_857952 [Rhizophagus irregularis]|uniref:Uncharacterized protein n=1 Tax=Rhizophagus irregularis TaxID=588596 RepID=A0A2N1M8X0_9GLOM|nr:hypothetical protein RhiirC2_857952 [Rhizophagus irregularis]